MSDRKLKAWQAAGLIDAPTAARISAWEAANERPLALWAVIGIAALAIGLGLISVVAANWDAIPGTVRLAVHFALMAGLGGAIWRRGGQLADHQPWLHEAGLFVLGMLGMTFLGHIGQVYQTTSPLWQPLAFWLALFAPLLMLRGQSWLASATIMVVLVVAVWNFAFFLENPGMRMLSTQDRAWLNTIAVVMPLLLAGLAAWAARFSTRAVFWNRLGHLAMAYGIGLASLNAIAAMDRFMRGDGEAVISAGMAAITGAIMLRAAQDISGRMKAAILLGGAPLPLVALLVSGSTISAALLFMALWAGLAAAALRAGWRGVFQLAVALVALRLVVLSFELESDLLTSGAGLIASGVMILAVAWGALRISQRFAPKGDNLP